MAGAGSFSDPMICTLSVDAPALCCEITKETVALAPLESPPRLQETAPAREQLPDEGVAETRIPVAGATAVSAILVDGEGPEFLIVAV